MYSNCGQFLEKPRLESRIESLEHDYPWPNSTTTFTESDKIVSKVTMGDFNGDGSADAVFISSSNQGNHRLFRVVTDRNFFEKENILSSGYTADLEIQMIFLDVDLNGSTEELIFISEDKTRLVVVDLVDNPGSIRFEKTLVEPLNPTKEYSFLVMTSGNSKVIEIGENSILIEPGSNDLSVSSTLAPVNGGWGPFSPFFVYSNGTTCSKTCGRGLSTTARLCNNPEPLNGGDNCSSTVFRGQAGIRSVYYEYCYMPDCSPEDCSVSEDFVDGSCIPKSGEPNPYRSGGGGGTNDPGGGSGGSDGGDGGDGGSGGTGGGGPTVGDPPDPGDPVIPGPDDCTDNEVWDPFYFRCFRAYVVDDIRINYYRDFYVNPEDPGEDSRYTRVYYNDRIGLNHPKAAGLDPQQVAREYCVSIGYQDVINFEEASYTATVDDRDVHVQCNIATNGYYYGGGHPCVIGDWRVSYAYGQQHAVGENIRYLKKVSCRNYD